jgi:hypothetical protein
MSAATHSVVNVTEPLQMTPKQTSRETFGEGRYSKVAFQLYSESKYLLGLNEEQAIKLSKAYASDLGRINSSADKIGITRPNKDGYITLTESTKTKGIKLTFSMRIAKLVVMLFDARDFGIEEFGSIKLDQTLVEWLNS